MTNRFTNLNRKIQLVKLFDAITSQHSESDNDASELVERERDLAPTKEEWQEYLAEKQESPQF